MITLPKIQGVKLSEFRVTIEQEMDTCGSRGEDGNDFQSLSVEYIPMDDEGGYIVFKTSRWALNPDEIDAFCAWLKEVAQCVR